MRVLAENVLNHIPSGTSDGFGIVVPAKFVECVFHESRAVRICHEMLSQLKDRKNEVLEFFVKNGFHIELLARAQLSDSCCFQAILVELFAARLLNSVETY